MPYFSNSIIDAALLYIKDAADAGSVDLHICSADPATHTEATALYSLGYKEDIVISGPVDGDTGGRTITIAPITEGTVTATGAASHFALVNSVTSELLFSHVIGLSQVVTEGNEFTTNALPVNLKAF